MTTKEILYAQNYIEQFLRNRRRFLGSWEYHERPAMRTNPLEAPHAHLAIQRAFKWDQTREGFSVWADRRVTLEDTYDPLPLF